MDKTMAKYFSNKKVFDLRALMDSNGITLRGLADKLDGISYDALERIMRIDGKQEPKAWQLLEIEHTLADMVEGKDKIIVNTKAESLEENNK
jgi:hypothetical protein